MNEVIRTIITRRSIRGYTDEELTQEEVDQIILAGRTAPNAWNNQTFELFIVTNPSAIDSLAEITAKHLGGEKEDHNFFGARLIIMVVDLRENFMRLADAGCIMENMMLAAHSMGIGSVWVNQFSTLQDLPEVIEAWERLGITRDRTVCCIGAFGYPNQPPKEKILMSRVVCLQ